MGGAAGIRLYVSLFRLICWAYGIDGSQLSGGPSWIRSERYAIEAEPEKLEGGAENPNTRLSRQEREAQTRERVKALLADRFQLAVRTEAKEAPMYVLSVASGAGVRYMGDSIESSGAPISFLAVTLTQMLGRPVLDETGIEGRFKYKLEFRPEDGEVKRAFALEGEPVADDDPRPSIFTALKSQLELELQSRKGPVSSVVIERIARPSEN